MKSSNCYIANGLYILLILNIDCYSMMINLNKNKKITKQFSHNFQKIMIMQEL